MMSVHTIAGNGQSYSFNFFLTLSYGHYSAHKKQLNDAEIMY